MWQLVQKFWLNYGSAFVQACCLAALAASITYMYTGSLGIEWAMKDFLFVAAVGISVFVHRLRLKGIIEHDPTKRILETSTLGRLTMLCQRNIVYL